MASPAASPEFIDYLVERKFLKTRKSYGDWQHWRMNNQSSLEETLPEEAASYKAQLQKKSAKELQAILENSLGEEAAERREREELEDSTRFFNASEARADYSYWSKVDLWTLDDATALSLGKEPKGLNSGSLVHMARYSPFARAYMGRSEMLGRARKAGALKFPVSPAEFVNWSEAKGLQLPEELVASVRTSAGRLEDRERLVAERDSPREELGQLKRKVADKRVSDLARKFNTLQRIFFGMAIRGYAHNPYGGASAVIKEIETDLLTLGIPVTDETIAGYLSEAGREITLDDRIQEEFKAKLTQK